MVDIADCQWGLIGLAVAVFDAIAVAVAGALTALCCGER